jgi:hypothetical protein
MAPLTAGERRIHRFSVCAEAAAAASGLDFARPQNLPYSSVAMTKLLEKAVETVRLLSSDSQDDIARAMLELANESEPEDIDPVDLPAVLEGLAQAKRGEYASAADVEAAFRRFES